MVSDPFLSASKKRKRPTKPQNNSRTNNKSGSATKKTQAPQQEDEEITSESDDEEEEAPIESESEIDSEEEFAGENAADKRRRLAKQYLSNLQEVLEPEAREIDQDDELAQYNNWDAADLDRDIIARRLQTDVAEHAGKIYQFFTVQENISSKLHYSPERFTCVAVHGNNAYTVSKDGNLTKWDIDTGKRLKYVRGGKRFQKVHNEAHKNGHHGEILAVAAAPNGKYIVTGGTDKRIIVWSTTSLSVLRVLETTKPITAMVFRRNKDELYVATGNRIRTYNMGAYVEMETLYGHQDVVTDISALMGERCVSSGGRERAVMLWKIEEESRLTFQQTLPKKGAENAEGSTDCVSMLGETHFISGSDNGSLCLWSVVKKRPLFSKSLAHGFQAAQPSDKVSAEVDSTACNPQQPFWITAVHAVPYSDLFLSASWDGKIRVWKLGEQFRTFEQVAEIPCKGLVTRLDSVQEKGKLKVVATISREHRSGRWLRVPGKTGLFVANVEVKKKM